MDQDLSALPATALPVVAIDDDGAPVHLFPLPTDEASLRSLVEHLFRDHWADITFGPIIQGAAWEMRASAPPRRIGYLDGYLTVDLGTWHFHLCIGPTKGLGARPTPPALAVRRRTARAELFRRIGPDGHPVTWGMRLWNGAGEQQMTVFLPNPFLGPSDKVLAAPDWSRLAIWDALRARWLDLTAADPVDRAGTAFRHA